MNTQANNTNDAARSPYNWPSREEWAEQRRTPYYDLFENLPVSEQLNEYATPEEIAGVVTALKALYADEGRKMKEIKRRYGYLLRQPREKVFDFSSGYFRMTKTEQEIVEDHGKHQDIRHYINEALRTIVEGRLPFGGWRPEQIEALFAPIRARYDAAYAAAEEERRREIEATPIDDAAWEEELRRRGQIDRHGAVTIIND